MKNFLQQEILIEADKYLASYEIPSLPMSGYTEYLLTGNRSNFEEKYYERRRQLIVLGLAYPKNKVVKPLLEQLLWEICNEYTWSLPAHLPIKNQQFVEGSEYWLDLFAAETGEAFAEILELFGEELSPLLTQRMRKEIQRRIFVPFLSREWDWERKTNNWSAVIGGCIGLTALTILPKHSEKQKEIIQRLDRSMSSYLDGYGEDGICLEGIGYWSYGFGYFIYYANKLADVLNDDSYLKLEKVKKIAMFPYYMEWTKGEFVPFSDYSQVSIPSGLLNFCATYFDIPVPQQDQVTPLDFDYCYRFAHVSRNLQWDKENFQQSVGNGAFEKYFADAQWWIVRKPTLVFAAKGGSNKESHNHLDVGHFVFGCNELFLTDLGAGEYSRDYFLPSRRYQFFSPSAESHSIPIINGNFQEPRVGKAKVHKEDFSFSLDLSDFYPNKINRSINRTFKIQEDSLVLIDNFAFEERENRIVENFIVSYEPIIKDNTVILIGEKEKCVLELSTNDIRIVAREYTDHYGYLQTVFLVQSCHFIPGLLGEVHVKMKIIQKV